MNSIRVILSLFLLSITAHGEATITLELSKEIKRPIITDGKVTGYETIPAGTSVSIRQEYPSSYYVTTPDQKSFFVEKEQVLNINSPGSDPQQSSAVPNATSPTSQVADSNQSSDSTIVALRELPDQPSWDQTILVPGKLVFLKLPFIKQKRPGICVAASAINLLRYLKPECTLSADELWTRMTSRPAGASYHELAPALSSFGIHSHIVYTRGVPWRVLVAQVQQSLDHNKPVLAADVRHMVLIDGYDARIKKLFVWNQWGNGKLAPDVPTPKGHYGLLESDLPIEFNSLIFVD